MEKQGKLNIVIVDDHKMFRNGIKLLIEVENIGNIVAEAENGQEFLDILETQKPDLVLMDIDMPIMNGIEATQKAIEKYPDLKILALSMFGDEKYYTQMIQAGAKGFILKKSGKYELEKSIWEIANG
ncbi:MAG: response regulator transcription factor, partial [Bacteroidales bacterium]|nr:response regulator transcription factor [Bacteroidales bacterium]